MTSAFPEYDIGIVVTHSQSTPAVVYQPVCLLFNGDETEAVGEQIHIIEGGTAKAVFAR